MGIYFKVEKYEKDFEFESSFENISFIRNILNKLSKYEWSWVLRSNWTMFYYRYLYISKYINYRK